MPTVASPRRRPPSPEPASRPGERARIRHLVVTDMTWLEPGVQRAVSLEPELARQRHDASLSPPTGCESATYRRGAS